MNKVTTAVVVTLLFGAQVAFAQAYYPLVGASVNGCVNITSNLSQGSRGDDVLSLQKFILTRNYPGAGNWMLTGYFGQATKAGVLNLQMDMRLPQTGWLDAQTRSAISSMTCGYGYQTSPATPYPSNSTQPWYNFGSYSYGNNYNGNCSTVFGSSGCQCGWYTVAGRNYFNNCGANNPPNTNYPTPTYPPIYGSGNSPTISNVSGPATLNVNTTGTWIVSVNNPYGTSYSSISVNWGDPVYGAYASAPQQVYGSQSATFTHAYAQSGTYTITFTVSNGFGSKTSTATVQVNSNASIPTITSITPSYGPVGTTITIYGTGFSGDNTVHFGNGGKQHLTSASGNYIYFTVPSFISPCDVVTTGSVCAMYMQQVTPGQYQVYVTSNGSNSNSFTFTVQ